MKIKKEHPKNKNGLKMPLGMKRILLTLLLTLVAKGIAITDEIFNAKVIEYLETDLGFSVNAWIGVDTTQNGITDMFILIPGGGIKI